MQPTIQGMCAITHASINAWVKMTVSLLLLALVWIVPAQAQDGFDSQGFEHYIIGGHKVQKSQYPWMVALSYDTSSDLVQRQFCGGSVIADRWVLTAAHCLFDPSSNLLTLDSFKVAVNAANLNAGDVQELHVTNMFLHPEYEHNANNPHSDIALLELASSAGVTPLKVSAKSTEKLIGLDATVIGWGAVDIQDEANPLYPVWLQSVQVPIVSLAICNGPQSYENALYENQLCAGYVEGGRDSCTGDSGGPLIVEYQGVVQQVGIVSFGFGCALPNYYGVYTDVPYFIGWINQYVYVGEPEFEPEQYDLKSAAAITNSGTLTDTGSASFFALFILAAGLLLRRRTC